VRELMNAGTSDERGCAPGPGGKDRDRARLAHLASLGLPLENRSVLEVGSGSGDRTEFFLARGCTVLAAASRRERLDYLQRRFPQVKAVCVDVDQPSLLAVLGSFEVVLCYELLCHLEDPGPVIAAMAQACSAILVLEACVSPDRDDLTEAVASRDRRPIRRWVLAELEKHFQFVYLTRTQPDHPEFPTDWISVTKTAPLMRAIFVASRRPLELSTLTGEVLERQLPLAAGADVPIAPPRYPVDDREQSLPLLACWCGAAAWEPFYHQYFRCRNCRTVTLKPAWTTAECAMDQDEIGFQGKYPWAAEVPGEAAVYEADWHTRLAAVSELNLIRLRTLLTYSTPGMPVLAAGSLHENFVMLMRLAGLAVTVAPPPLGDITDLSPRFGAVVATELMGRSPEPLAILQGYMDLLASGGFLMAEVACLPHRDLSYRDLLLSGGPALREIQQGYSRRLFTPESVAMFAARLQCQTILFEETRFGTRALFLAATGDLTARENPEIQDSLLASQNGRIVLALLALADNRNTEKRQRRAVEAERTALAESQLDLEESHREMLRIAAERLSVLNAADAELKAMYLEAQRRADALVELTAAIKARDARIQELERTAEERLRALLETDAALRRERAVRGA
jgi:SAM-dependent methyltransferase